MYLNAVNIPIVMMVIDGSFDFHFHQKFYAKPVKNKFAEISFKKDRCCNMEDLQGYSQTDLIDQMIMKHRVPKNLCSEDECKFSFKIVHI